MTMVTLSRNRQRRVSPLIFTVGIVIMVISIASIWFGFFNAVIAGELLSMESVDVGRPTAARVLSQGLPSTVKIHRLSEDLTTSPSSIVTGYFRIPSKHSSSKYDSWMKNMLSLQDPMIVFTQAEMVDKIRGFRQHALNRTVIVELELEELPITKMGDADFWPHQLEIDVEKKIHAGYQVFWIWLSKSWLVVQGSEMNPFDSSFFMWCDIGSFRDSKYNNRLLIQHAELVPDGSLIWMAHRTPNPPSSPIWADKLKERQHFYQSGSQAAGSTVAWRDFHKQFAITIDRFVAKGLFIGEDQTVIQGTCQSNPHLCLYAPSSQVRDNNYFGLRHVLHFGGDYQFWRPPAMDSNNGR